MNINNLSTFAKFAILTSLVLLAAAIIILFNPDPPVVQPTMTTVDIDIISVNKDKNLTLMDNSKELANNSNAFNTLAEAEAYVAAISPSSLMSSCPDVADKMFNVTCYHPGEHQLANYISAPKDIIVSNVLLKDLGTVIIGDYRQDTTPKKYYVAYTKCN